MGRIAIYEELTEQEKMLVQRRFGARNSNRNYLYEMSQTGAIYRRELPALRLVRMARLDRHHARF